MKDPIAQHYFTSLLGIKTHFVRLGKGSKKIVFLHGWGGSWQSFWLMSLDLCQQDPDLEITLLDYPGFGQTDFPPIEGWSTHDYANWMDAFLSQNFNSEALDHLNFYVHSFGGRVLTRWCLSHPTHKGKLIFTGSAGIKWPLSVRQSVSVELSKTFAKAKKVLPARIQKFILCRVFGARDWGVVVPELKPTLAKVLAEPDFREELPKIKNQTLILWGAKDRITPLKSGEVWHEKMPQSRLKIFADGRHGIHHTHREVIVDEVLSFLK